MAINKRNEDGNQQEERGWQLTRGTRMAINKRNEDGYQQEERGWQSLLFATRETLSLGGVILFGPITIVGWSNTIRPYYYRWVE
jgi:hypothetical protein